MQKSRAKTALLVFTVISSVLSAVSPIIYQFFSSSLMGYPFLFKNILTWYFWGNLITVVLLCISAVLFVTQKQSAAKKILAAIALFVTLALSLYQIPGYLKYLSVSSVFSLICCLFSSITLILLVINTFLSNKLHTASKVMAILTAVFVFAAVVMFFLTLKNHGLGLLGFVNCIFNDYLWLWIALIFFSFIPSTAPEKQVQTSSAVYNGSNAAMASTILENQLDQLKQYKDLLDRSIITSEEYEQKKHELLGL